MAYFYSASQRAFYCTEIVSVDVMPADKVAVADEAYIHTTLSLAHQP